jgi:DNA-binding NarL/FixJ family response regulator
VGQDAPSPLRANEVAARWGLSPRETQILALLGEGLTNRAIAAQLGIEVRTVETHLTSMFGKAQVESRAELVVRAWRGRIT